MSFHIDLKALNLDSEVGARISAKISAVVLAEIAHLDLSEVTTIAGRLGPGIRGLIAIRDLKKLADIAGHEVIQKL